MHVAETYEMLRAHGHWPDGQPWEDQPNKLYSAVRLYGSEVAEIEKGRADARAKKARAAHAVSAGKKGRGQPH